MGKKEFLKENLLSFVSYLIIMVVVFYFVFPEDTISEHITTSTIATIIYHIPALIKYFKKDWAN